MLVCNVSLRPPRTAIAADLAEITAAADAPGTGNVVFATLVDDPASVGEIVDAYLGEIMLEAASAAEAADAGLAYQSGMLEATTATDTPDATSSHAAAPPLDAIASLTGAWSLGRDLLTSFAGGTRYTTVSGAVNSIKDQSSGPINLDQSTSTKQPLLATAFPNNVACADFDGVDDVLTSGTNAISDFIAVGSGALVASVIIDAATLNIGSIYSNHDIIADNSGYIGLIATSQSGLTLASFNWDGNADSVTTTGTVGTAYVLMWRHHGGNLYLSVNGGTEVSVASGNTQNVSSGVLWVGSGYGSYCNMKLAEMFTTSDGSQTAALAAAIADMKTYIGA